MLIAAVIGGLFLWSLFGTSTNALMTQMVVSLPAALCAGAAFVVSLLFYLWSPKKHLFAPAFVSFLLLLALASTLVMSSGQQHSPFLALWMLAAVFAAVFGIWGLGAALLTIVLFVWSIYMTTGLTTDVEMIVLFGGIIPLIIGYFIWHTDRGPDDENDHAYRELASELSQVSGKSDVVINAIADGVIAVDSKGVIELINPAAQSIIGWGKQDALRLNYKSVLKLIDNKNAELNDSNDPVAGVLRDNKPVRVDMFSLVTVTGKKILISLVVSPVGQIGNGAIIVFRDITREKAEEREQAEFISTASHEMRTPVASIEGYLGLVLNPNTAAIDDRAREFIGKAHESAQHLGRLFQDLLDVSKADDGRMQNTPAVVEVVDFIADVVEGLRPKSTEKGLRLLYKPRPDGPNNESRQELGELRVNPIFYAHVDPDHLREVTDNLVENAIKYTPSGDVIVDVTGDADHITISIQDSGIGIPPEDIGHLFQKFYRVDNSQTREIGGTGLGLYLCRRLVEAMNGRIWVESVFQKGSTFFVELPRLATEEATRQIEQTANIDVLEPASPGVGPAVTGTAASPFESVTPITVAPSQPEVIEPVAVYQAPPTLSSAPVTIQPPEPAPGQPISLADIERHKDQYVQNTRRVPVNVPDRQNPQ